MTILGFSNVAGRLAADASSLYARNVYNFVAAFWDEQARDFKVDWDDEIIKGVALTRDGAVVHPQFVQSESAKTPEGEATTEESAAQNSED